MVKEAILGGIDSVLAKGSSAATALKAVAGAGIVCPFGPAAATGKVLKRELRSL